MSESPSRAVCELGEGLRIHGWAADEPGPVDGAPRRRAAFSRVRRALADAHYRRSVRLFLAESRGTRDLSAPGDDEVFALLVTGVRDGRFVLSRADVPRQPLPSSRSVPPPPPVPVKPPKKPAEKKKPTLKVKWSVLEVTPDHNSQWPPSNAPFDVVPAEAKVSAIADTTEVADGTAAEIVVHRCSGGAAVPHGTIAGLSVKANQVQDPATGKAPEWVFTARHQPWDPWDKPWFFFEAKISSEGLTERTHDKADAKALRVLWWDVCVADAIADTPAGGNLTTGAEMAEIAGILAGTAKHKVYQRAFNQRVVTVALWGSVLRNSYTYHHASHGDVVDRTTGAQLNAGNANPPTNAVGNWRSVIVLGSTNLGDAEVRRIGVVPSTPRYLAYLDTCVAGWEPSFANAFIARGTRNVLAFRMYIPDGDARQMARDFYKSWCNTHKCDPAKIPTVFFAVGGRYYGSMRPVLFGAGGGAIPEPPGVVKRVLKAIGSAIVGVVSAVASVFR